MSVHLATPLIIDIMFANDNTILPLTGFTSPLRRLITSRRAPHRTPRQHFSDDVGTLSTAHEIIVSYLTTILLASMLEGIGMRHSILLITLYSGAAKGTKSPNNVGDISPQLWYSGSLPRITTGRPLLLRAFLSVDTPRL